MSFPPSKLCLAQFPRKLVRAHQERSGVETRYRAGLDVAVTSLERTLVDLFDRPELGGGVEEVWRSLGTVEFFVLERSPSARCSSATQRPSPRWGTSSPPTAGG